MPLIVYSALRLLLFGVALAALAAVGLGGWLLVVIAAFAAWGLSYALLAGPRDKAALWISERVERRKVTGVRFSSGVEADAVAEDAEARLVAEPDAASQAGTPVGHAVRLEGEPEAEEHAVGELERTGTGQDGPQQDAPGAHHDGGRQEADRQSEHQHEK